MLGLFSADIKKARLVEIFGSHGYEDLCVGLRTLQVHTTLRPSRPAPILHRSQVVSYFCILGLQIRSYNIHMLNYNNRASLWLHKC